jgi:hypothetical protein
MDQVVAADGRCVAVSHQGKNGQIGADRFDPAGESQSPPMGTVQGMGGEIIVSFAEAANSSGYYCFICRYPKAGQGSRYSS